MPRVKQVDLAIRDSSGREAGRFSLHCLPSSKHEGGYPLWDFREDPSYEQALEPVQILEGKEYRFQIECIDGKISTDKPELITPDDEDGRSGRLRPGIHTGGLPVRIYVDGELMGEIHFEVRSFKLDYFQHYRWMLRDIASSVAEIVSQSFAPTRQTFTLDPSRDPATLYQQFAFLHALITGPELEAALAQILARPHRKWERREERRDVSMGLRGSSQIQRLLVGPGPRRPYHNPRIPTLTSLPVEVPSPLNVDSVDTPENRFVKYVLTHWRGLIYRIRQKLESGRSTYPVERGLREVDEVLDFLDGALAHELFREVGDLKRFPVSSTVLHRRQGYRQVFYAYLQSEIAAQLTWSAGDDVYGAGQRDVATLYEFWVYFELAKMVAQLCNQKPVQLKDLLEDADGRLNIRLRQGKEVVLRGSARRFGRLLDIELYFNRGFSRRSNRSWTRPMRPDCSLRIRPLPEVGTHRDIVWLHFDAKYRVEEVKELFGDSPGDEENEEKYLEHNREFERQQQYKRADLLKMHAYRDAIRRSTGAYVIYPGDIEDTLHRYEEILPGLGAFPLGPSELGLAEGTSAVRTFLSNVLTHLALQSTQHERGRYWTRVSFAPTLRPTPQMDALSFLDKPPADEKVLIAFIKSPAYYAWTVQNQLLCLSRDEEEGTLGLTVADLGVDFVLLIGEYITPELWAVRGETRILTNTELRAKEYPDNSLDTSLVFPLSGVPYVLSKESLSEDRIQALQNQIAHVTELADFAVISLLKMVSTADIDRVS